MPPDLVTGLGILLLAGFIGGRISRKFKIPAVTGYIIVGILLGPSVTNIITTHLNESLEFVKVLGLGLIALVIGGELHFKGLRELGKSVLVITIVQVFGAFVVVFFVTRFILGIPLPICLLLGAMASATAPASPVAVIREYKARGPLTNTLLAVVGLDDAACILLFSLVAVVVEGMLSGVEKLGPKTLPEMLIAPFAEVGGSIFAGALLGLVLVGVFKFIMDRHQIVVVLIGMALLGSALSQRLELSALLVTMVMGLVVVNLHEDPHVFAVLEDIELPIFVIFFALAGASLHLDILVANWFVAVIYIVARGIGKVGGAFMGAHMSRAPEVVRKYLGFAMFSKAGVTIGLVLLVQSRFPEIAAPIIAVELAAVAVCELIGPMGTRFALVASGEASA